VLLLPIQKRSSLRRCAGHGGINIGFAGASAPPGVRTASVAAHMGGLSMTYAMVRWRLALCQRTEGRSADMCKTRPITLASIIAIVAAASMPTVALAATAGWMVNGTPLSGSKTLATTAKTDENAKISFFGLVMTCSGANINNTAPQISPPNMGTTAKLELTGCVVSPPCVLVESRIVTEPLLSEVTLEDALATTTTFRPKAGTTFSTFEIEGEACGAAGNFLIDGAERVLSIEGQIENTLQQIKSITTEASKELFVGKSPMGVASSALLKLASGERWSFL
jgi:hypothetical protein